MKTPRTDTSATTGRASAPPRRALLSRLRVDLDLRVLVPAVLALAVSLAFGTMSVHAQGYGAQGRGGELSNLLHAYFPVARPTAGNAKVNRRQASDLVRAASGGSVDVISVRTQGNTHYVKVLTRDRPPKMQTYKVDASTGRVWR